MNETQWIVRVPAKKTGTAKGFTKEEVEIIKADFCTVSGGCLILSSDADVQTLVPVKIFAPGQWVTVEKAIE